MDFVFRLATGAVLACIFLALPAAGQPAADCTPDFPFRAPWQGADAAYSLPLPDGRVVWIFGDTLYGDERVVVGRMPRMVHNSIGISTCGPGGEWELEYVIKKDEEGNFRDFFPAPQKESYRYWALAPFLHGDHLWVTLLCVRDAQQPENEALGFETCGADLAKVSNIQAHPREWTVRIQPLVPDGVKAYPSAAAVVHGKHAYIFALYEDGTRPLLATRIPLARLDRAAEHLQFLARDGRWKSGFKPADAKPVMERGGTELSISYHAPSKQWLAVMNEPVFPSDKIILRTAKQLTGPYSEGQVIYTLPDMQKDNPGYDPDTFCYAAKEHPQYRRDATLVFTYTCNTFKVNKLVTDLGIYFPKAVRVDVPAGLQTTHSKTKAEITATN